MGFDTAENLAPRYFFVAKQPECIAKRHFFIAKQPEFVAKRHLFVAKQPEFVAKAADSLHQGVRICCNESDMHSHQPYLRIGTRMAKVAITHWRTSGRAILSHPPKNVIVLIPCSVRKEASMHLIAPDVLFEAKGLSPFLSGTGVLLGSLLWLFGWRWYRFWVVLGVTLIGGLVGLQTGRSSGGHILAMGILLALSSGLLALELARVFAFLAAGSALWMAACAVFPNGRELWIAFLFGGLLGVLLYRFWTMLLTSFLGVLIGGHSLICLLEKLVKFDAAEFARSKQLILNGAGLALTVLGLAAQSFLERWHIRRKKRKKKAEEDKLREKIIAELPKPKLTIWDKVLFRKKKKAA